MPKPAKPSLSQNEVEVLKLKLLFVHVIYRTPLHLACAAGHAAVVQELLEWNAKTNVGDGQTKTPLMKVS